MTRHAEQVDYRLEHEPKAKAEGATARQHKYCCRRQNQTAISIFHSVRYTAFIGSSSIDEATEKPSEENFSLFRVWTPRVRLPRRTYIQFKGATIQRSMRIDVGTRKRILEKDVKLFILPRSLCQCTPRITTLFMGECASGLDLYKRRKRNNVAVYRSRALLPDRVLYSHCLLNSPMLTRIQPCSRRSIPQVRQSR